MKRLLTGAVGLLAVVFFVVTNSAAQGATFKGEITDEQLKCLQTPINIGEKITDKTACVLYLAHWTTPGSKYVLHDAATKTTYHLDDQLMVKPWVASKVIVTGTLDAATKTIKVTSIKTDDAFYKTAR